MIVRAECCVGHKFHWRLTMPDGQRATTDGTKDYRKWDRSVAKDALDLLEIEFNVNRRNVRFSVR